MKLQRFYPVSSYGPLPPVYAETPLGAWSEAIDFYGPNKFSHISQRQKQGESGSCPTWVYDKLDDTPSRHIRFKIEEMNGVIPMLSVMIEAILSVVQYLDRKILEYQSSVRKRAAEREKIIQAARTVIKKKTKKRYFSDKNQVHFIHEMSDVLYSGYGMRIVEGHPYV